MDISDGNSGGNRVKNPLQLVFEQGVFAGAGVVVPEFVVVVVDTIIHYTIIGFQLGEKAFRQPLPQLLGLWCG